MKFKIGKTKIANENLVSQSRDQNVGFSWKQKVQRPLHRSFACQSHFCRSYITVLICLKGLQFSQFPFSSSEIFFFYQHDVAYFGFSLCSLHRRLLLSALPFLWARQILLTKAFPIDFYRARFLL